MAEDPIEGTVVPQGPEILKLSTDQEMPDERRIDLFSIDGTTYSMLLNPPPIVGLRYLELCRDSLQGANAYLLEVTLGEEAYQALLAYQQLTEDQYNWILEQIVKRSLGAQERPKARPGTSGRNNSFR
jgi:hypothetical protein